MAINVKKGVAPQVNSMKNFLVELQKDKGEEIGSFGGKLVDADRIPTGLFPLDLALAGGFPRGFASLIYGPESSAKTTIALRLIAMHQLHWPNQTNIFFDIENSFDPLWARRVGVNTEKLIVINPKYGEQLVDIAESALLTDDCGILAIDSLAAVLTTSEGEASAERATVGGSSLLIGKLVRKMTNALGEARKYDRSPTVVYINQIRSKVGVVYGNPDTMPGGRAPRYQCNLILRVYGKNEMDPTISTVMPVLKDVKFVLDKVKCPVVATSGTFQMATLPHKGLKVAQCDDFNTVSEYLKAFGQFEKDEKKGWLILGQHYDTIAPFKKRLYLDNKFGSEVRATIIKREIETSELLQEKDDQISDEFFKVAS